MQDVAPVLLTPACLSDVWSHCVHASHDRDRVRLRPRLHLRLRPWASINRCWCQEFSFSLTVPVGGRPARGRSISRPRPEETALPLGHPGLATCCSEAGAESVDASQNLNMCTSFVWQTLKQKPNLQCLQACYGFCTCSCCFKPEPLFDDDNVNNEKKSVYLLVLFAGAALPYNP